MKISLLIAVAFLSLNLPAQFPVFEKYYSDTASVNCNSLARDTDGGYIMAGTVPVGNSYHAAIYKTDSVGNLLWTRSYGDQLDEYGMDVRAVSSGGYILVATRHPSTIANYVVAIRINSTGGIVWQKVYAGGGLEEVNGVEPTYDGGFLISGTSGSYGVPGAHVIKTLSDGTIQWRKVFGGSRGASRCSAKEIPLGGYILTTRINDSLTAIVNDVMVARLNPSGDTIWTLTYGGNQSDEPYDVDVCADGSFIVSGRTYSYGAGTSDIFLSKISSGGQLMWTKTYGGTGIEISFDADETSDGGYIISGWTDSFGFGNIDALLIRTNANGDTLWTSVSGTSGGNFPYEVVESAFGNFLFAGSTYITNFSDYSAFLYSVDYNGYSGCNTRANGLQVLTHSIPISNLEVTWYAPPGVSNTVFSPGSRTLTTTVICSGTNTTEQSALPTSVAVFPNPVDDQLTINGSVVFQTATIYNLNGQIALTVPATSDRVDVSALTPGMYALVLHGEHNNCSLRFIKK
jgi:hypothetical protein